MINDLLKFGKKYKNIVVLSAGSQAFKVCQDFQKFFPDRYFSFGLGYQNMVSSAAGFALRKKIPIVVADSFYLFSKAFEQIYNDICLPNLNVKFIGMKTEESKIDTMKMSNPFPNFKYLNFDCNFEEALSKMFLEYGPMYVNLYIGLDNKICPINS